MQYPHIKEQLIASPLRPQAHRFSSMGRAKAAPRRWQAEFFTLVLFCGNLGSISEKLLLFVCFLCRGQHAVVMRFFAANIRVLIARGSSAALRYGHIRRGRRRRVRALAPSIIVDSARCAGCAEYALGHLHAGAQGVCWCSTIAFLFFPAMHTFTHGTLLFCRRRTCAFVTKSTADTSRAHTATPSKMRGPNPRLSGCKHH